MPLLPFLVWQLLNNRPSQNRRPLHRPNPWAFRRVRLDLRKTSQVCGAIAPTNRSALLKSKKRHSRLKNLARDLKKKPNRPANRISHALDPEGVTVALGRMILSEVKVRFPSPPSDVHRFQNAATRPEPLTQNDVLRGSNLVADDKRTCELRLLSASLNSFPTRSSTNRAFWNRKTSIAMKHPELKLLAPHAVEDNANLGQNEGRGRNELLVTIGHRVHKPR